MIKAKNAQKTKESKIKKNILANYLGQVWRVAVLLFCVPLYIKYLGIESYGLITIFVMLQAYMGLLDLGMKPALGREMARFTAGAHNKQAIWDLLRSIEMVIIGMSILLALGMWAASGWLATNWVKAGNIKLITIEHAFAIMGIVIAFRFIESLYSSSLAGLQRQVLQNVISIVMVTLQGIGAVAVLACISPTIEMFFAWQLIISLATVLLLRVVVYRVLPLPQQAARFSWTALLGIWRFAAGMASITLVGLMLTQLDKLMLSFLLPLEMFGYYALAALVASGLDMFTGPVASAIYPHFIELLTQRKDVALRRIYHQSAQLISVLTGPVAAVLMLFPERVLLIWTGEITLSHQVAPIMSLLVLGTLFHCMLWIPYQLQLAHGWTNLTIKCSAVAIILLIPCLLYVTPIYGPIGVAWVWVALNAGFLLVNIPLMHQRILTEEKWTWYWSDVIAPIFAAFFAAVLCRWLLPTYPDKLCESLVMASSLGVSIVFSILAAPLIRQELIYYYLVSQKVKST